MKKNLKQISKYMSWALRHKPAEAGLNIDQNGWVSVEQLIRKMRDQDFMVDKEMLEEVVETNDKKRFAFNDDKTMIRASQGHSIEVDLGLASVEPPEILYHGTSIEKAEIILKEGIKKMNRQHIHLSVDIATATIVGSRHGKPRVLAIAARQMYDDGFNFYLSANGVWLTDFVDLKYISV